MTDVQVGRFSVRVLVAPLDTPVRVGRESVRALYTPTDRSLRVGRESVRALLTPTDSPVRQGRLSVRVLTTNDISYNTPRYGWGILSGVFGLIPPPTPGGFRVDSYGSPIGSQTINILLPADAAVDDLAIITTGHRSVAGVPTGATQVANSLGGQSTSNQQETRTSVIRLTSTHVTNGYVPFTSNWGGTAYGFTVSVQLAKSEVGGRLATFDAAAAGPTNTNGTSKATPAFNFSGPGRRVFHAASFFQNSGGGKSFTFPAPNDQVQTSVDREYAAVCAEVYDPTALSQVARTWSIGGGINGGMGTTAVAVHLA